MKLSKPQIFSLCEKVQGSLTSIFSKVIESNNDNYQDKLNNLYAVVHGREFISIYNKLIESVLETTKIKGSNVLVQKNPTIRIQEPNEKSVPFHIDKWSGHPNQMLNIWIPLSQVYKTSALYIISRKQSKGLIQQIENGNLSLKDLDVKATEIAAPHIIEPGSFLIFSNEFLHGTVVSKEEETRYSLDFRIALEPKKLGNKKINIDYVEFPKPNVQSIPMREAHSVIYAANKYRDLGHKSQRAAINEYASMNSINIISEASEFIGCIHTPQIDQYLEESGNRLIICFSKHSFSEEQLINLKHHAKKDQKRIIFALEDKTLSELR